jgi:hypothetical protein
MKTFAFLLIAFAQLSAFAQSAEEKQLLALHERKFHWLTQKQYDSLTLLLDDRVLYIHSNGWTENKAEILADLQSGKLNYESVQVKEATARLYQDAGVVTGKGVFKVLMEGKSLEISLLYTEVYVRHKKQWRLVSRHACRV